MNNRDSQEGFRNISKILNISLEQAHKAGEWGINAWGCNGSRGSISLADMGQYLEVLLHLKSLEMPKQNMLEKKLKISLII